MEPELRAFLIRIVQTISITISWMIANSLFGIKMGYIFWGTKPVIGHVIYYLLLIASAIFLLRYLLGKWKKAPKYDRTTDTWIYRDQEL